MSRINSYVTFYWVTLDIFSVIVLTETVMRGAKVNLLTTMLCHCHVLVIINKNKHYCSADIILQNKTKSTWFSYCTSWPSFWGDGPKSLSTIDEISVRLKFAGQTEKTKMP